MSDRDEGVCEVDTAEPMWATPFASLWFRLRMQLYVIVAALIVVLCQGIWLYKLGSQAAAHVYEVHPDGKALYIGNREAHTAPRRSEVRYVATTFAELLYGWNSSTVHQDLAHALGMCSAAMARQFRQELADAQYIAAIRQRGVRSELAIPTVRLLSYERRYARVRVAGHAQLYPLTQYEGSPVEVKPFDIEIVMAVVPRDPVHRRNGLEIVRVVRHTPDHPAQPSTQTTPGPDSDT